MDLRCLYARGLELPNPLIAASAGTTEIVDKMRRCEDAGMSAVVMKTLFEDPVARRDPAPMFRVLQRRIGAARSTTFYTYEQAAHLDPQQFCEEIRKAKEALGIKVIGSCACVSDEAWSEYPRLMEQAGADAVELNLSCPYSAHLTDNLAALPEFIESATRIAREAVSIPLTTKLTPQMSSPSQIARLMERAGSDGVVPFSRFAGLDIDIETEAPIMHGGMAGHGGPWSLYYVLGWLWQIDKATELPISSSGGVWNAEDVVKHILVGADTVQLCTVLYLQGYGVAAAMLQGLRDWMETKGYTSLADFRGKAVSRVKGQTQVERRQTVVAAIDPERCTSCGTCVRVCPHGATKDDREGPIRLIAEECSGCGLCGELCPVGAISLRSLPEGYRPRHRIAGYYDVLTG
ncbi:MAG: 4Fe-4S dicluster domain-containing protein [Armatimonadetes bacterium]|nr:4Fe-4S dicluster domain-containing protein [Armatimonadota bacterium]